MLWSTWWVWVAGAIALGIFEMLAPGFIFLGFAVGAAVAGLILLVGAAPSLPWLLVIFGGVSLVTWLVLRQAIGVRKGQSKSFDTDINEH
ncbi:NfeD family protein [Aliiroseovarius sp. 2305UL8-7]|uniref:NfeD family protein n=1 Tax=Aliiroseovarius conchicola TaxID=3121637 RepID=UPI00352727AA